MGTFRKKLREALAILGVTIALYWVVDAVYGLLFPMKSYADAAERLTAPAYAHEPYFSEPFLSESFAQPGHWSAPAGAAVVMPSEFHGRWFNVDPLPPTNSTFRRTINPTRQDEAGVKTVLILGASVVYASEVPDDLTIASQLSARLNAGGARYFVINAGVSAVNSKQELARLQYELEQGLKPSDVILYDGMNDIYIGVYRGRPGDAMISPEVRSPAKELARKLLPLNIRRRIQAESLRRTPRIVPPHLADRAKVAELADETMRVYTANVRRMQALSRQYGFRLHVLPAPCALFGSYEHPGADLADVAKQERHQPDIRVAFGIAAPKFHQVARELAAEGIDVRDLTELFVAKRDDIFLDFWHVNSVGNRMAAEAMISVLLGSAR